jgi:hypothetical protein
MLPVIYNYQMFIETKYIGQTNNRPSRVKATNVNSGVSATVSWDHGLDMLSNHLRAAAKLYEDLGETPKRVLVSSVKNSGYIFTAIP